MRLKEIKVPKLPPLDWKGSYEEQVFVAKTIGKQIVGYFVPYRYLYAFTVDKEWRGELPFIPVGISGLVKKGNKILFGKRSQKVTQYKGFWELPPSGSITQGEEGLDPVLHLLKELKEETGITKVTNVKPLAEMMDQEMGRLDLCYQIEVAEEGHQTDEYQQLLWLPIDDTLATLGNEVVPLSRHLFFKYGSQ